MLLLLLLLFCTKGRQTQQILAVRVSIVSLHGGRTGPTSCLQERTKKGSGEHSAHGAFGHLGRPHASSLEQGELHQLRAPPSRLFSERCGPVRLTRTHLCLLQLRSQMGELEIYETRGDVRLRILKYCRMNPKQHNSCLGQLPLNGFVDGDASSCLLCNSGALIQQHRLLLYSNKYFLLLSSCITKGRCVVVWYRCHRLVV